MYLYLHRTLQTVGESQLSWVYLGSGLSTTGSFRCSSSVTLFRSLSTLVAFLRFVPLQALALRVWSRQTECSGTLTEDPWSPALFPSTQPGTALSVNHLGRGLYELLMKSEISRLFFFLMLFCLFILGYIKSWLPHMCSLLQRPDSRRGTQAQEWWHGGLVALQQVGS